jgi:tetratricopeptide (TPR) repeat protein
MNSPIHATLDPQLAAGIDLETSGRLDLAAGAYQNLLRTDPDHPGALHRLGLVMGRLGHRDLRLQLIGQAVARSPEVIDFQRDLGEALLEAGHPADALESFRAVLALGPDAQAAAGVAEARLDLGDAGAARAELAPYLGGARHPRLDRALGRLALAEGRATEAVEHLMIALRASPADAAGLFYLGVALQAVDLLEPSIASYQQAVALDPTFFEAWSNLSTALLALGRADEALAAADSAVSLVPNRPGAWLNRANAARDAGDLEGAGSGYRRALELDPAYAEAWSSLANLYHDRAEWSLALEAHARAAALAPDVAQIRWNQSFTLLATGQLETGWAEYEARLETEAARPEPRDFPWPQWDGDDAAGKRILVWREQGIGDELLFAACLPGLVRRGAKVTLLASPRLVSLFARAFPSIDVRTDAEGSIRPEERFDGQIAIGSLPRALRLGRADFRSFGPFLVPDPAQVEKWRRRLAALPAGLKVGICWRSGLLTTERLRHYAPLAAWRPVLELAGGVPINLQYDDCAVELEEVERAAGVTVHRWPDEDLKNDLESVVGLLASLDAVVSAPTAVTSLAGAVGVPTWQIDSGSDWTVFGEDRSPWFPSVRVVRKGPDDPDWTAAVGTAVAEVGRLRRS